MRCEPSKVVLLVPPIPDDSIIDPEFIGMERKARELEQSLTQMKNIDCEIIDLAQHIKSSKIDGLHLEEESHRKIAELVAQKIMN